MQRARRSVLSRSAFALMMACAAWSSDRAWAVPPFRIVSLEARADGLSDGCTVPVHTEFEFGPVAIPAPGEFVIQGWTGNQAPGDPCGNPVCGPDFISTVRGSRDSGVLRLNLESPAGYGGILSCDMTLRLEEPTVLTWTCPAAIGWGSNAQAQIPPEQNGPIKAIEASVMHSLAIRQDGVVLAWGQGAGGVPDSARDAVSIAAGLFHSMAARADGTVVCWGSNFEGVCNVPPDLGPAVAVAAGFSHSLALRADGRVAAWGSNGSGQTSVPAGLAAIRSISAGWFHSLAVRQDGSLVAWGANGSGQVATPPGIGPLRAVDGGSYHTLALRVDGSVAGWGDNSSGQISIPAGLGPATAVSAGSGHSVALLADGSVVCWGANRQGQSQVPAGLPGVTAIAAGGSHTLVLADTVARTLDLADLSRDCVDPDGGEPSFPIDCRLSLDLPLGETEARIELPDEVPISGFEVHGCWSHLITPTDGHFLLSLADSQGIADGTYEASETRPPDCTCTGGGQVSTSCGSRATVSLDGNRIDIDCSANGTWPAWWGCEPSVRLDVAVDRPYVLSWSSCFEWLPIGTGPCPLDGSKPGGGSMVLPGPGTHVLEFSTRHDAVVDNLRFRPLFPADVVPDGVVDATDLGGILGNWGPVPIGRNAADINMDGLVGGEDIAAVLGAWGSGGSVQ